MSVTLTLFRYLLASLELTRVEPLLVLKSNDWLPSLPQIFDKGVKVTDSGKPSSLPEAVFLVVCDPSMNELCAT